MAITLLEDRKLVRMSGADAETLLQRLITTNLDKVAVGEAGYGALLTPQGKILFDFLVTRQPDGFLFDLDGRVVDDFIKKMTLYRLRSAIAIDLLEDQVGHSFEPQETGVRDPRSEMLGWRLYGQADDWLRDPDHASLMARFVEAGIPQAGTDFDFGDAFPHDVNMDLLGGIDFSKGCYVGQEVVSRMQHRGTARKRLVQVEAPQPLGQSASPTEATISAGGKALGTLGQVSGNKGLALVRLDRVADAIEENQIIEVMGMALTFSVPDYANFSM